MAAVRALSIAVLSIAMACGSSPRRIAIERYMDCHSAAEECWAGCARQFPCPPGGTKHCWSSGTKGQFQTCTQDCSTEEHLRQHCEDEKCPDCAPAREVFDPAPVVAP